VSPNVLSAALNALYPAYKEVAPSPKAPRGEDKNFLAQFKVFHLSTPHPS